MLDDLKNIFSSFELDSDEKRVVIVGMKNKEISPKDIYDSLRTNDRNRYDKCVTALRINDILEQIRTNANATQLAKINRVKKNTIFFHATYRVSFIPPHSIRA